MRTRDSPRTSAATEPARIISHPCLSAIPRQVGRNAYIPRNNISVVFIGMTARTNCKVPYILQNVVSSKKRTCCSVRVAIVPHSKKSHSLYMRLLILKPCMGLPFSTIVQTNTARTSNAPNTTSWWTTLTKPCARIANVPRTSAARRRVRPKRNTGERKDVYFARHVQPKYVWREAVSSSTARR